MNTFSEKKLVSVIIPCHNQGKYLKHTLDCLLRQTYKTWECIMIDDGSTDITPIVAKRYVNMDDRFRYFRTENNGVSAARNYALDRIKGDYIQFIDSDDIIAEEKLKSSVEILENNATINAVITNYAYFKKKISHTTPRWGGYDETNLNYEGVLYGWDFNFSMPPNTGLFRKKFFTTFRFDTAFKAKEDWFLWLQFFKEGNKIFYDERILAFYRYHKKSMTKNYSHMNKYSLKAIEVIYNGLDDEQKRKFFLSTYDGFQKTLTSVIVEKFQSPYFLIKQLAHILLGK